MEAKFNTIKDFSHDFDVGDFEDGKIQVAAIQLVTDSDKVYLCNKHGSVVLFPKLTNAMEWADAIAKNENFSLKVVSFDLVNKREWMTTSSPHEAKVQ